MQENIVGCTITQLKFQGNDVFTLILSKDESKFSLNLIGCILLSDTGCVGNVITQIDISDPGMMGTQHLHKCDSMGLEHKDHRSVYIETQDRLTDRKCEIYVAAKAVDFSNDPYKYN